MPAPERCRSSLQFESIGAVIPVVGRPVGPGAATDAPYQHRFVADAGTARAMTRALMSLRGVARFWFGFVVVLAIGTALSYDATDLTSGTLARLAAAVGRSFVLVVPVWTLVLALLYLLNLRVMHRRVPEGAVWQSGFEDHDFFVSGPLSSHRYSYELVRSVVTRGEFVFVQLRGNAAMLGYPRALFPGHELARLVDHASRQPRSKTRARTVIVLVACAVMLGFVVARAPVHRDAPDYEDAAAIAQALHTAEIRCSYRSLTGAAALHATSAGECTGDHFVVQMYVYETEQQRQDRQAVFDHYWCGRGAVSGGWVTGRRWLIGLAHGTGATTRDLPDLLGATGGDFESPQCDEQPNLGDLR